MPEYDDYKVHVLMENFTGVSYKRLNNDERMTILNSEAYEDMPSWPSEGSIKMINDVLVVKLS